MPDPLNNRLAARLEQLQIERIVRVESIANSTDAAVDVVVDRVLAASVSRLAQASRQLTIEQLIRSIPATLEAVIERQFIRLAYWSQAEFVGVLVRTIPRRWFRKINPASVLVGEDQHDDADQFFAPGVNVDNRFEPILAARLTDEEWAAWVAENVFPPPARETVLEIIHRPNAGVAWKERIRGLSKLVEPEKIASAMTNGLADGKNIDQLSKDVLKHVEGGIKASARRIARTEGLRVANTMQRDSYADLGDLSVGIQILETLDQHTRPHHALRHGQIFYKDGRQPDMSQAPVLPDEPNCRGFDIPVMVPPEEFRDDPVMASLFQNAGGHAIPDPATYSEWWAKADVGRQKLAVGYGRWNTMARKLGGTRAPEWEDFIHPDGKRLKVKDINGETPDLRERRRQKVFGAIRERTGHLLKIIPRENIPNVKRMTIQNALKRLKELGVPFETMNTSLVGGKFTAQYRVAGQVMTPTQLQNYLQGIDWI